MSATPVYNPNYHDDWVWSLCMKDATDNEVAHAMGVSVRTINRWKLKHESFRKKMEEGKSRPDAKVEASLLKRATGYEFEETESLLEMDQNGNQKPLRIKKTKKHVPPDTLAIMYWLNNRSRKTGEWSQRQDVNVSFGDDSIRDAVRELTLDEARAKLAAIRAGKDEEAEE